MHMKKIATIFLLCIFVQTILSCGIAFVRLRKPLIYYQEKYGDPAWGLHKLYLLMEKQRNRGQDGAGIALVKFDPQPGQKFLFGTRSAKRNSIARVFDTIAQDLAKPFLPIHVTDQELKTHYDFLGEVYLGHLRYGTHGGLDKSCCQPKICKNDIPSQNIAIAGNFNLTNTSGLLAELVKFGLCPTQKTDTHIILNYLSYCLNREHHYLKEQICRQIVGQPPHEQELCQTVARALEPGRMLQWATRNWDGGYVFAGIIGNGDAFICRDPSGIRPVYIYIDDEVVAAASERVALANVFNTEFDTIKPINPGTVFVIKQDGTMYETEFKTPQEKKECLFERIYFSRMHDPAIYKERKALGKQLAPRVLEELGGDISHAVFTYIPNSGETACIGLVEEINRIVRAQQADTLWEKIKTGEATRNDLDQLAQCSAQYERLVYKDQALRTFITHDAARKTLVSHIYDVTKDIVKPEDTLVIIDDSIVRGITLREAIITQLSRLKPKRIIVVCSCPPILYPDCYGIDMSQLNKFIAFQAAQEILRDQGKENILEEITQQCLRQNNKMVETVHNYVKRLYDHCSHEQLEKKIAELARPTSIDWDGQLTIIYQTIEGLHKAIPNFSGDWYFTGQYPTTGGYLVVNRSYINQYRGHEIRAY